MREESNSEYYEDDSENKKIRKKSGFSIGSAGDKYHIRDIRSLVIQMSLVPLHKVFDREEREKER